LLDAIRNPDLIAFVHQWDIFEALMIRVYRGKERLPAAQNDFEQHKAWIAGSYPHWREGLQPFCQSTRTEGAPKPQDPFMALLALEQAMDISANWPIMQLLPAARETINLYLRADIKSQGGESTYI
jgi:hypothetical protein